VVSIFKGGDRSAVTIYRPIILESVVCNQLEHVTAGYLSLVWEKNDWLYEGKHGFNLVNSCESEVITVCQDIEDSLGEAFNIDAIIIDYS
jgi:hypothetical protein